MLGLGLENEGRKKEEPSGEARDQQPEWARRCNIVAVSLNSTFHNLCMQKKKKNHNSQCGASKSLAVMQRAAHCHKNKDRQGIQSFRLAIVD